MRVDGGVASRARERFIVAVGDMLASLGIFVAFTETEINHIAGSSLVAISHQEIVGLHVSMKEVVSVHVFQSRDHLVSEHTHRL